jgi:hypothetical protein
VQDQYSFPPRSASRLDIHDDGHDGWEHTARRLNPENPAPRSVTHSRESSLDKIGSPSGALAGIPESPQSSPSSSVASPGVRSPTSRSGIGGILERVIDPKAAAAYGHHRQTSIVHGIQHSRNGSLASSSSSPLSPQMIAAAGVGLLPDRPEMPGMNRMDSELSISSRPPTALSGTTAGGSAVHPLERTLSTTEGSTISLTQRKMERMHSKTRRDPAHHRSHSSRHHKDDQKTVGEYALHVLFTSVCTPAPQCLIVCGMSHCSNILTFGASLSRMQKGNLTSV